METNKIILPNGMTISEAQAASSKHTEHLHMEKFAKGHYVIYSDERSPKGNFIRANANGSEDLMTYDPVSKREVVVKRLSDAGKGKLAYLLKSPEFQKVKKELMRA